MSRRLAGRGGRTGRYTGAGVGVVSGAAPAAQAYLQNIDHLSALTDLQFAGTMSANGAYGDWTIGNAFPTDTAYNIDLADVADAGMVVGGKGMTFDYEVGVSSNGGGPSVAQTGLTAQAVFGISIPIKFSTIWAEWPTTNQKLCVLNQSAPGGNNQVIIYLARWAYGGAAPLAHYVDVNPNATDLLNVTPGTGRGTFTPLLSGVEYEIEVLLTADAGSAGICQWWVRDVDANTAPVLQGNYSGLTGVGNISEINYISQFNGIGANEGNCPTTFTETRGRTRSYGTAA